MKFYYLAHPVRPDAIYTEGENLRHAGRVQHILWACGIKAVMPWYSFPLSFPHRTHRDITEFLAMNCELVRRFDGIILAGHRVSEGMEMERKVAEEAGLEIIDLIGKTVIQIPAYIATSLRLGERNEPAAASPAPSVERGASDL